MKNYLNFETDIKNLEDELDKLKDPYNQGGLSEVDTNKISKTQRKTQNLGKAYNIASYFQKKRKQILNKPQLPLNYPRAWIQS